MRPWIERIGERHTRAVHGGPQAGGSDPDVVDFSVNVNPFAPAPGVADAWSRADPVGYPDPASLETCRVAARLWEIPVEAVRFAPGATELLHRAALAWLAPGAVGVVPEPCFAEYARAVTLARGRALTVPPLDSEGTLDLAGVLEACRTHRAGIVYLGRPNTPTGASVDPDRLIELRAELPRDCLLVLDESFVSFEAGSVGAGPVLGVSEGVLSIRSITKDCGLAGLRAGFAVGSERVLRALDRVALPWAASAPAQVAARVSLEAASVTYLDRTLGLVRAELHALTDMLRDSGLSPLPSRANFACVRVPDASALADELDSMGLRLRRCASFGLPDHLRIGIRRPEENRRLTAALRRLLCV
ncbi:MAG: histidinol-phosphate transaminase [Gemmatimonadota bacterium]